MQFIVIGTLGFVLLFIADLFQLNNKHFLKNMFAFFGTGVIFTMSIAILLFGTTYDISFLYRFIASIFTVTFLLLMIYSILVEVNTVDNNLITTGTYALSRHPGVLWFLLYYVFGSFVFGNIDILIAGLIWTIVNGIYVLVQERVIFHKVFKDYGKYQEITPMLIPNLHSIKKCIQTLHGGKNERSTRNA